MILSHRAIAVQGVGYSPPVMALQGFWTIGEAVQVALEVLAVTASLLNPNFVIYSQILADVLALHAELHEPFAGLVQIIQRGMRLNVDTLKRLSVALRLKDE